MVLSLQIRMISIAAAFWALSKCLDADFTSLLPNWTLVSLLTFVGMRTLKNSRNKDGVGLTDRMLLLKMNLDFVFLVKVATISTNGFEKNDRHN